MMKSGKTVLVVDSVEAAVKFYSDKLAFDIVSLTSYEPEGFSGRSERLAWAELRKGKCHVCFRVPYENELVEFNQIKYCTSRGVGLLAEMKQGIEKYYSRCRSKGVTISQELKEVPWGAQSFAIKDPFGFRVVFSQDIPGAGPAKDLFVGMKIDKSRDEKQLTLDMISHIQSFNISRRAAKKFAKSWLKKKKK